MSLNATSPFCASMCCRTYPANRHCSVVFRQKCMTRARQTILVPWLWLYLYPRSTVIPVRFLIIFHLVHTNAHTHITTALPHCQKEPLISKAWISATRCLFSLNNSTLNTFFNCQWQKLRGFTFHLEGKWAPGFLEQLVGSSQELTKAKTQTKRIISRSSVGDTPSNLSNLKNFGDLFSVFVHHTDVRN